MLVIYFGFVLLVAFSPSTLGQSLSGGVTTVGMLVGVVIVGAGLCADRFLCLSRQQRDRPAERKTQAGVRPMSRLLALFLLPLAAGH